MFVAIKLYKDVTSKPNGIPDIWPAEVRELGDSSDLPEELSSDIWHVMSMEDFQDYKAQNRPIFDAWYAQYTAPTPQTIVKSKILSAKDFGESLLVEIATDNVLAGASQAQILALISNNLPLILALKSGSLYTALTMVSAYAPDALMTSARIAKYVGEIKTYLGIA